MTTIKRVDWDEYTRDLTTFALKHNAKGEMQEYTYPMENGYGKLLAWEDGANFYECNEQVFERHQVEIETHGLTFLQTVTVALWRHEYWSTEFGSRVWYESADNKNLRDAQ